MDFKTLSKYIGNLLVLLAFGFLFYLLLNLDFSVVKEMFRVSWIPFVMTLSILFSLFYFLLSYGWKKLLELSSQRSLSRGVIGVYLKTVVYKYVPGNVFHFLGRHSLVESENLSHKSIVFANGAEILMQLFSVSTLIMMGAIFFDIGLDIGQYVVLSRTKIVLAFALLIGLIFTILFKKKNRQILFQKEALFSLVQVFLFQILFLLSTTLSLVAVFYFLFDLPFTFSMLVQTIFASTIAWLLGFIVPGAPGGIGIREAILVLLLPSIMGVSKEIVLAGALIYRVVTILGEGLTYFWAKRFL